MATKVDFGGRVATDVLSDAELSEAVFLLTEELSQFHIANAFCAPLAPGSLASLIGVDSKYVKSEVYNKWFQENDFGRYYKFLINSAKFYFNHNKNRYNLAVDIRIQFLVSEMNWDISKKKLEDVQFYFRITQPLVPLTLELEMLTHATLTFGKSASKELQEAIFDVFKARMLHELGESFRYRNESVFNPHLPKGQSSVARSLYAKQIVTVDLEDDDDDNMFPRQDLEVTADLLSELVADKQLATSNPKDYDFGPRTRSTSVQGDSQEFAITTSVDAPMSHVEFDNQVLNDAAKDYALKNYEEQYGIQGTTGPFNAVTDTEIVVSPKPANLFYPIVKYITEHAITKTNDPTLSGFRRSVVVTKATLITDGDFDRTSQPAFSIGDKNLKVMAKEAGIYTPEPDAKPNATEAASVVEDALFEINMNSAILKRKG